MTNIYIDFSKTNPVFGNTLAGHIGEHNATNLIITPPKYMSEDDRVINYVVAFETESGERYKSDIYAKNTNVETPLYSQLTTGDILYIQLEGCGENNDVIIKSDVVFIRLGSSLGGGAVIDGSVKPQENIIQFGWSPKNKEVLEGFGKISEDDIQHITYNETKLQELEQFKAKGYFKTEDFLFVGTDGSEPSSDDNRLYIYCYDIPNDILYIKDIIIRYSNSKNVNNKIEYRLSKANNYYTDCQFIKGNDGLISFVKTKDPDMFFNLIHQLKGLTDLLSWISEENPITVIIEYEIPYFN